MLGGRVKNYQVWGQISQGGMSDVWLARHDELAFPVIIKTMRPKLGETFETQYARLVSEARLMGRLANPHVVRVLDIGEFGQPGAERAPYLVEEYVDGIDLGELDRQRRRVLGRPLPLWAVASFVAQAAEGLHAAHQVGVVHRDVKPSNLFGNGQGSLKVGDFGVAMPSGSDCPVPAGTPVYMAPEQLLGERVDRRADIYSLGATAYVLRYGASPYSAARVQGEELAYFPAARSPEESFFQHVIGKMLARRPEHRHAHMAVLKRQLESLAYRIVPDASPTRVAAAEFLVAGTRVVFQLGDLAKVQVDAVVNSAYTSMRMRSGVGDALRRRGGDGLEAEAMQGGERALGDCVLTGPGTLPVSGVIHAVAAWNEVSCVARSTHRALLLAEAQGYRRIAFPALGTGQGRVALEASMDAILRALWLHLRLGGSQLEEVKFVLVDEERYARALEVGMGILSGSNEGPGLGADADAPLGSDEAHASTLFGHPAKREGGQTGPR